MIIDSKWYTLISNCINIEIAKMDQNYQYNPNGEDDNYDRRPTRFSNLNQNYPYSERQQPPRLPFHFSGNEGYNQPMYNIPPPPPP